MHVCVQDARPRCVCRRNQQWSAKTWHQAHPIYTPVIPHIHTIPPILYIMLEHLNPIPLRLLIKGKANLICLWWNHSLVVYCLLPYLLSCITLHILSTHQKHHLRNFSLCKHLEYPIALLISTFTLAMCCLKCLIAFMFRLDRRLAVV